MVIGYGLWVMAYGLKVIGTVGYGLRVIGPSLCLGNKAIIKAPSARAEGVSCIRVMAMSVKQ